MILGFGLYGSLTKCAIEKRNFSPGAQGTYQLEMHGWRLYEAAGVTPSSIRTASLRLDDCWIKLIAAAYPRVKTCQQDCDTSVTRNYHGAS